MNILLDSQTLIPEKPDFVFRSQSLYGLKRLSEFDNDLYITEISFNNEQRNLLEEEHISLTPFNSQPCELHIKLENAKLSVYDSNEQSLFTADNWGALVQKILFPDRKATVKRKTGETDISVSLNLDGSGISNIDTGLGFFDHMLDQIAKHGLIDLDLKCKGDLNVDEHHTIEDVAIALGRAIDEALGNKTGIERYGFYLPMDETVAKVGLDLSGRPYLVFKGSFKREYVGDFPTEMLEHFFYSLAMNLNATLRIEVEGENEHHKIEACFKGFARSLRQCLLRFERTRKILPSSKGML
ncbi:MAG TPA: imidazoleglycerol-phosphate dehydratase HisB [Balneolales bacterium]|nr:imidazoleglycerol-phosphate dehydratase HisB [Balneolales bacterium]